MTDKQTAGQIPLQTAIDALGVAVTCIEATGARDHAARCLAVVQTEVHAMLAALRDALAASDANCGDSLMNALCEARDIIARIEGA